MDPERRQQIADLVRKARRLPEAGREKFIEESCAGDADLLEQVRRQLIERTSTDGLSDLPVLPGTAAELGGGDPDDPARPTRLGPYKILGLLGEGGMGTVYLAEQEEPVKRKVALKVIGAIHHRGRRKRFAAECQAMARLSHPNIAAMYEVGATEDGHPFIAMELVDGSAITDWCDDHELGITERLRLFDGVCAAVRHAHEKGILHRDLKPSNVLVTEVDGQAVAKVIDFGIARALDGSLLEEGTLTQERVIGSPGYMGPEALTPEADLDTRSDVYSLGAILYKLLVGVLPFSDKDLPLSKIMHKVLTEPPAAPSIRFAKLKSDRRKELASVRAIDEAALVRTLKGDLDAIVLKCTDMEKERRYGSPADLSADLGRYLRREPIEARPPSVPYVLGRFLRRRAGVVSAIGLLVLALIAGTVARDVEARRANRQARRAEQAQAAAEEMAGFLVSLFEVADPDRASGEPAGVRELLDRGAERLRREFEGQPLARARFLQTIGEIYTKMGEYKAAEDLIAESLSLRESELPPDDPYVADSLHQLALIISRQRRYEEAEPLFRRVVEARESASNPDRLQLALAHKNLGDLLRRLDRMEDAEASYRRALAIRQRVLGRKATDVAESLDDLAQVLVARGKKEEAAEALNEASEILEENLGTRSPRVAAGLHDLSRALRRLGRLSDAEQPERRAVAIWEKTMGARHPLTVQARKGLAEIQEAQGEWEKAVEGRRKLLALEEEAREPEAIELAGPLSDLGFALANLGEYKEADDAYERAVEILEAVQGEESRQTLEAMSRQAWAARVAGKLRQAERANRKVLEIRERTLGPDHPETAASLHELGATLSAREKEDEAEPFLRRALEIRREKLPSGSPELADTLHELGVLLLKLDRRDEGAPLIREALEIRRRVLPPGHRDLLASEEAQVALSS